jgi:hypothetical protein
MARSSGLGMGEPQISPLRFQQLLSLEVPPSPLSSRPERSVVERSAAMRSSLGNVFVFFGLGS